MAQHNGDFSATAHTIIDPKTGEAFPGNIIPQSPWDPIGAKLLSFIPSPNIGTYTLAFLVAANQDDYQFLGNIDYAISAKDHLSARCYFDRNLYQRDNNSLAGLIGSDIYQF